MASPSVPRTPPKRNHTHESASLSLASSLLLFSSPTKPSGPKVGSRLDIENSPTAQAQDIDENFAARHLSSLPPDILSQALDPLLVERVSNATGESVIYEPLAELLNTISRRIYSMCHFR